MARAKGFEAGRLERVEHCAQIAVGRSEPRVERGIMMAQPQGEQIRRPRASATSPRSSAGPGEAP